MAFVNLFNNALLRSVLWQNNASSSVDDYGITAISHPLPESEIQLDSDLQSQAAMELFTAICVIFALAFIPASFLVFLIDERVTTSKHLQFVSGVKGERAASPRDLVRDRIDLLVPRRDVLVRQFSLGSHQLLRLDCALHDHLSGIQH